MDQLRKAWGWLVRHHFWVLVVVATAVAIGCWYSGASALSEQFKANKSKIDSQFTAISGLRGTAFKPNNDVNEKQKEQIAVQQKSVHEMWQQLYDRQRADVLQWPTNLSEQFRTHVEGLKFGEDIPGDFRDHYSNYVRDHFPELPKIVGAILAPEGDVGGGGGRGYSPRSTMDGRGGGREMAGDANQAVEEEEFIVEWLDQQLVREQLYMATTPSAKRIWKTQEDLWVYEALLKIIAATNKAAGADRFSNAAVRVIESMEVGRSAAQQSRTRNRIDFVAAAAAEGGGDEFGGGDMGGRGGDMGGGDFGGRGGEMMGEGDFGGRGGMGEGGAGDAELFANRYIGDDGLPMAAEPDPSEEFKRLPIRLRLTMDERWLPQLIAECANAPLQVDVQEVRINPSESGSNNYGGGGGRGSMSGEAGEAMVPEAEPSMKTVVIQGIIYIFNPPTDASAAGQVAGVE